MRTAPKITLSGPDVKTLRKWARFGLERRCDCPEPPPWNGARFCAIIPLLTMAPAASMRKPQSPRRPRGTAFIVICLNS